MRQTQNKKKVFKRKTKRRRVQSGVQSGGVQEQCAVCKKYFHKRGTIGATTRDELYEDHIKTHPECKYCDTKHVDVNSLIEHIKSVHPDKYEVAEKIKFDILNKRNLIDELRNQKSANVGVAPEFNTFYNKIDEAINTPRVVIRPSKQTPKKSSKQTSEQIPKQSSEQKEIEAKNAIREEQKRLREEAEIRKKQEEEKKKEVERIKKEEEQALKMLAQREKKQAKKERKIAEQEIVDMEAEELLSNQLRKAETVDEVIDIIENNAINVNASVETKASIETKDVKPSDSTSASASIEAKASPISIIDILRPKDFEFFGISKWYWAIYILYPAMIGYTEKVNGNEAYKNVSYFIIFLVGVINFRLRQKKLNLKLILKGGKASQMIMSKYGQTSTASPASDDVDILLVQDGIYDYHFLLNFASDFANIVNAFFGYQLSILAPPDPRLTNQNIVKISFLNNKWFVPLSDIDLKPVESEYLHGENIITSEKIWEVYDTSKGNKKVYTYNLLFYHQTLDAFVAEKKHYLQIYDNIIQKKNETEVCDCAMIHNYECSQICGYRKIMLEKFRKYIEPLERLQQSGK